jgi:hypothetical protein
MAEGVPLVGHSTSARVSHVVTGRGGRGNMRGRASRTDRASGLRGKQQRDSGYNCKWGEAG